MACKFASLFSGTPKESSQANKSNFFSLLFESSIDPIITIDNHGIIEAVNPAALEEFQYEREELLGQNVHILMPEPYHSEHDQYLAQYRKTGKKNIIGSGREVLAKRKDGSQFPIHLSINEFEFEGQKTFFGIARNISKETRLRAALEEQKARLELSNEKLERSMRDLEEQREELKKTNQYKSEFLANMSHELRTPLNSLLILAKLLAENSGENLTTEQVEYAEIIHQSGSELLTLINDILDLAKVEVGQLAVHKEEVSVQRVVKSVEELFRVGMKQKNLEFTSQFINAPESIVSDRMRLEQILKNLVSNAQKFTEVGSIAIEVEGLENGRIEFRVRDTGIGIPEEKYQFIFDAFKQIDGSLNRSYAGTGLGLSISQNLASLLGGSIRVESQEGKGSLFTLNIPQKDSQLIVPPSVRIAPPPEEPSKPLTNREILLIEDHDGERRAITALLERSGFQVTAVDSVEKATNYIPFHHFGCVILDLGLGSASGTEIFNLLESHPSSLVPPFIIYTGKDISRNDEENLLEYSDSIIMKGVKSSDRLVEEVQDIMAEVSTKKERKGLEILGREAVLKGKTVLVVDDDMRNAYSLKEALRKREMEVLIARNGQEAIDMLHESPGVSLVLMDVMMPEMNGYEATKKIRLDSRFKSLPIIALTAKAMVGDRDTCLEAGASDYLAKPVDLEKLSALMSLWVQRGGQ